MCADCVTSKGLCGRDHCRRQVLPLLKRPTGLLRLMGEALVEQKGRQASVDLAVSIEQAEHRQRKERTRSIARAKARKNARAIARSQRRGLFGLHRQIANGTQGGTF